MVVDSGGYGRVTIDAVGVDHRPRGGVRGHLRVRSGARRYDQCAGAGIQVVLRGLAVNGQGGDGGISVSNGSDVAIERCTSFQHGGSPASEAQLPLQPVRLSVADSVLSANQVGVSLQGASQHVTVVMLRTRIERSAVGDQRDQQCRRPRGRQCHLR